MLNKQKANAQESRDRAETELRDIPKKEVQHVSSQSDLRPIGTIHDADMPPANKYDQIVGPPEQSPEVIFGCVEDDDFIASPTPGHIFERHCPHPQPAAEQPTLPIDIETHVLLSSLASNPDYRRENKNIVHSVNAIFDPTGPFIVLKTSKEPKARRTLPEGGGGVVHSSSVTPQLPNART